MLENTQFSAAQSIIALLDSVIMIANGTYAAPASRDLEIAPTVKYAPFFQPRGIARWNPEPRQTLQASRDLEIAPTVKYAPFFQPRGIARWNPEPRQTLQASRDLEIAPTVKYVLSSNLAGLRGGISRRDKRLKRSFQFPGRVACGRRDSQAAGTHRHGRRTDAGRKNSFF